MVTEYIRYKIANENVLKFIEDYKRASMSLDQSPYCKGYDLTRCVEDGELLTLRILWTSTEDHLQKFRKSKEFQSFLAEIRPYIGNILEMQHYESTLVVSKDSSVGLV